MVVFISLGLEGKYMQTASTASTGEVVLNLSANCEDWVSSYFCQRLHFPQEETTEGFLYVTRSENHLPTAFTKEQEAPCCSWLLDAPSLRPMAQALMAPTPVPEPQPHGVREGVQQ